MILGCYIHLSLLLTACATGFVDLPKIVEINDSVVPDTVVVRFNINCTTPDSGLSVSLTNIDPDTPFFNTPAYFSNGSLYIVEVILSPSAALDAKQVNQYALTIHAECVGESAIESKLFIRVTATDSLDCKSRLADTGRVPIQVLENLPPKEIIYKVILQRPGTGNLTYSFEDSAVPFNITSNGEVRVPDTGFSRAQAGLTFSVMIVVTDTDGRSCRRPLAITVLPVYHNEVNFTKSSQEVTVKENLGPLMHLTQVHANGKNVVYQIISPISNYFTIETDTGLIRNTYNLDLKRNPELANTLLVVKAYNLLHPADNANITVNITVQRQNLQGPECIPAIVVTEIPETSPIGYNLIPFLACSHTDGGNDSSLHYQMGDSQNPPHSFRMEHSQLQVNNTLDCDNEEMVNLKFLYRATILVMDSGSPTKTTTVSVLVTVSRVNEYAPECSQHFFSVPEDAAFERSVGNVNGTDRDYPFNNIEYSILGVEGGVPSTFYIGRRTGELYVLRPLDYETQKSYHLVINLKDLNNDIDFSKQRQTRCNITINVQNVNDEPPECTPPFSHHTIYSTRARTLHITDLNCTDKDNLNALSYNIVGGNINGRFVIRGNRLFHNTFSYVPGGIYDPTTFELLVEVTERTGTPRFSTTATITVDVIPWSTTVPTTTTTTTTVAKGPNIVHRTDQYWAPDPWFVVVLTLTGALLLATFGLLFWHFYWRKAPAEISEPLLKIRDKELQRNNIRPKEPSKDKGKDSSEVLSQQNQFDGRAQDPVTGQYYLFDSSTGNRRWE